MKKKLASVALTAGLTGAFCLAGVGVAQAAPSTPSTSPVSATSHAPARAAVAPVDINQVLPNGSTLAGTFTLTRFVDQGGQLVAQGLFNGTLTSATGAVTPLTNVAGSTVVTNAANAVAGAASTAAAPAATGTCSILSLTLGPLHLDLLGLVVDLNQVNLNITAQSGSGQLLGNLLCSVAGLLDNGNALQGLTNLLNNLLGGL